MSVAAECKMPLAPWIRTGSIRSSNASIGVFISDAIRRTSYPKLENPVSRSTSKNEALGENFHGLI